ncbi:hypothetical protein BH11BAC1_BH11BAC1_00170 [soil metagenome]
MDYVCLREIISIAMRTALRILFIASVSSFLLPSCSSNKENGNAVSNADSALLASDTMVYNETADFKFSFTIANLPSPMNVISTIYTTQVPFDNTLLNPTSNEEKYLSSYKRAINYGIYGVDMAYIAYYGNKQDLYDYYSTAGKLAEELGIQETFEKFTDRFKENYSNKDSIMVIVDNAYSETDKFLRTNSRLEIASYILAGSFLESLYIGSGLMKDQDRGGKFKSSFDKIYEQKLVLNNLTELFTQFKDKEAAEVEANLLTIKKVYDGFTDPEQVGKEAMMKIFAAAGEARNNTIK